MNAFNNNVESAYELISLIDKRIEIKFKDLKFNKEYSATVVAVGSGVADIKLMGATNVITNVKNETGKTLQVGDQVYVLAINNSLDNIVINIKK